MKYLQSSPFEKGTKVMEKLDGAVVISKAGRDKGNFFVVLRSEDNYAYIADGNLRRVDRPKKKKLRHLQLTNYVSQRILGSEQEITNSEVRKALAEYSEN